MNSADVIGYAFQGALYCKAHKPLAQGFDVPVAAFLDDGQQGDTCDTCGEFLPGCELEKGTCQHCEKADVYLFGHPPKWCFRCEQNQFNPDPEA